MKKILIIILLIAFAAAAYFGIKTFQNKDNDINTNTILIRGGGNEPGWMFEVKGENLQQNRFGFHSMLDYGERHINGTLGNAVESEKGIKFNGSAETLQGKKIDIALDLTAESCVDDAEKEYAFKAKLTVDDKTYSGCGGDILKDPENPKLGIKNDNTTIENYKYLTLLDTENPPKLLNTKYECTPNNKSSGDGVFEITFGEQKICLTKTTTGLPLNKTMNFTLLFTKGKDVYTNAFGVKKPNCLIKSGEDKKKCELEINNFNPLSLVREMTW